MKTCPVCGHEGDQDVCPNDGSRLLTAEELENLAPTRMGETPFGGDETQVGEVGVTGFEATRAEEPVPVGLEATRAEEPAPAALLDPGADPSVDVSADVSAALPGPRPVKTQAPAVVPKRAHPVAVPVSESELRGENFGQWAEPKIKKKPKKDPMIGRTVAGRYEIIGLLGKGGMGAVYKARQPAVQRMIALKVLLQEFAENETVIRRFHQEAMAASRLTHPNTISVYDFGQTEDGILYIAMEYLRGQSLAQAQGRGQPMAPKRVIHIMRQVCKSLAEAHKAGIIHRDLKPDNIFLVDIEGERDFVKVLDFGVAKLKEFEGKEGTLTQAGMIFGTPKYMSPEQARSGSLDPRSDVYALGVILYEMLVGRAPFLGENPLAILIAHVNERPPPFHELNPDVQVPPALQAVVFKALAKKREDRQGSVDELATELEAVDQLLDGASYESVAAQLPGVVPGMDGSPSLAGPAIVPAGTDETQRGLAKASGNTVRLDAQGNPLGAPVLVEAPPEEASTGGRGFPLWALAAAVPVLGLGIWFFMQGPGPAALADAGAPGTQAPASVASGAPPTAAPPSVASAPPTDAPASVESRAPATEVAAREFMLRSEPDKARVIDLATGESVGTTYLRVAISKETTYIFKKTGYLEQRVTLSPDDPETQKKIVLKPRPEAVKPEAPPTKTTVTVRRPPPESPPTRAPVASPKTADVPIELQ